MGEARRNGGFVEIISARSEKIKAESVRDLNFKLKKNSLPSLIKLFAIGFSISAWSISCAPLPNVQGRGEAFFQGIWAQDSVANADKLLNYTRHRFKVTCDSFYVELTTLSKVNYYADSCFHNGVWKEYAKGTYQLKGDTLILTGTFTKANFKQKISGCYRVGQYLSSFKIRDTTAKHLQLESLNDQREVNLTLKQKINCVPKEL